jgi:geranylgeranyl pyrophosphate synthase
MSWDILKIPLLEKWKTWWIQRHPDEIGEYSWVYLFERGKQIRPKLFCELWSYLCKDRPPCIELAFIIECIHVATLILDDCPWMDNANQRRGWETLHSKFSCKKSFLIGHDIIHMTYLIFTSHPLEYYTKEITESDLEQIIRQKSYRLWKGQLMDLRGSGSLFELASMKTGVLFELVTETVAICVGLDRDFWRLWGNNLGVLFQWMDDWNDREEDKQLCQRNAFNENEKSTLLAYTNLWNQLSQSIGSSWFDRPFGVFMKSYFTDSLPLELSSVETSSISSLLLSQPIPVMEYKDMDEKRCLKYKKGIYFMQQIEPYFSIKMDIPCEKWFLKTNLWEIPEKDWRDQSEIDEWIKMYPWIEGLYTLLDTDDPDLRD